VFRQFLPVGEHQGRLILFGEKLLDSTGSTPMSVHFMSRIVWELLKRTSPYRCSVWGREGGW
jgi:hypothetical protein